MINLEDIDTKENLIQDFYRWLFDNNNVVDKSVILEKEVDSGRLVLDSEVCFKFIDNCYVYANSYKTQDNILFLQE